MSYGSYSNNKKIAMTITIFSIKEIYCLQELQNYDFKHLVGSSWKTKYCKVITQSHLPALDLENHQTMYCCKVTQITTPLCGHTVRLDGTVASPNK
jgi:hypothetical protein